MRQLAHLPNVNLLAIALLVAGLSFGCSDDGMSYKRLGGNWRQEPDGKVELQIDFSSRQDSWTWELVDWGGAPAPRKHSLGSGVITETETGSWCFRDESTGEEEIVTPSNLERTGDGTLVFRGVTYTRKVK